MQIQSIIKKSIFYHLKNLNFACPAVVTNVDKLKDGLISVQPVIDRLLQSGESERYSTIDDVPIIFPSSSKSSLTFPVNEGDGVLLIFCDKDTDQYKAGVKENHIPMSFSFLDMTDAVAFVGFNPFDESPFNPNNFTNQIDLKDFNIVHNKKTDREIVFSLKEDGSVSCISPKEVSVTTPKIVAKEVQEIDCGNALVKTTNDVSIKGKSVFTFMTTHIHAGVQSGTSSTAPPTP